MQQFSEPVMVRPRAPSLRAFRAASLGLALMCGGGLAQQALAARPAVAVHDAWIRWLPAGLPAGGYMLLENRSGKPVELVNADSPRHYSSVKLHESVRKDGVMSMTEVERVIVPPHSSVHFKPGGYHIMLINPKHAIKPGQHVPITLRFADGSRVSASFVVRKTASDGGAAQGEPMHRDDQAH